MYFIQKSGVYGHGVFWIGESVDAGKQEADRLANADSDSYHDWELCVVGSNQNPRQDALADVVYTGVRAK